MDQLLTLNRLESLRNIGEFFPCRASRTYNVGGDTILYAITSR